MTWSLNDARQVQARIAEAVLAEPSSAELGDITLLPHQRDAVSRIRSAIRAHHGALLADDVGLGKTYTALAVASAYVQVHVIAPAALQSMWRTAITHAGLSQVKLHSIHGFSRHDASPSERLARPMTPSVSHVVVRERPRASTLVIIDEAHHLRTRRTARYAAIARFVSGCDTLLLSATPLHNRADDLRHLLALFLGSRADLLSDTMLAQVVIRRTTVAPSANGATVASVPSVQQHPAFQMPHDRATLTHILALPAPLPAHDGAVAGALIRLGLLRAWCSSDAALAHALRQRRLRGDALLQSLRAGRHPTQSELRSWLVGDHEVQLAFPELMAHHDVDSAPLLERLEAHLEALAQLAVHHDATAHGDAARADALRQLVDAHPNTPIIAFSQFTQTIGALQRALSDIAGVGLLSGTHARIASGRISRSDALARFAPLAQERPPPPTHQAIRLLLSTDLLAEGVNLQDAGVVVHLDLPWTAALREQRVGRCARLGSPHAVVHVYRFAPPPSGDRALRLHWRLARKARLAVRLAGSAGGPTGGRARDSAAEAATRLHARLRRWVTAGAERAPRGHLVVGVRRSSQCAWLALIEGDERTLLLCAREHATQSHRRIVSARTRALLYAASLVDGSEEVAWAPGELVRELLRDDVQQALRDIRRWQARRLARDDAGPTDQSVAASVRRVTKQIEQLVQRSTTMERAALRPEITGALRVAGRATGSGAEDALERWCALTALSARAWLTAWQREPVLATLGEDTPVPAAATPATEYRVLALLLIGPDYTPNYHSACHDTRSCSTSTAP